MAEVAIPQQIFQEIFAADCGATAEATACASMRRHGHTFKGADGKNVPNAEEKQTDHTRGRRSGCPDYGRRPRRQAILQKRGNMAKIHPAWGSSEESRFSEIYTDPANAHLARRERINRGKRACFVLAAARKEAAIFA